ncbi:MAG: hypothetical protein HXL05_03460, partial [Candidatus Nanosynbacter sp.]|nr:hypothetical protein [Candidatus Nanosynbacter sp.]
RLRRRVGRMLDGKSTQHNRRHTQQNRQQNQRFEFFPGDIQPGTLYK